jgi:hypothetical protein
MGTDTLEIRPAWADGAISELSIVAKAIHVDDVVLAAALAEGQTIAQVARANRVKAHRVVIALVSYVVAEMAGDIRRGELTADQIKWLVALATWRAEHQITSRFPSMEFRLVSPVTP